MHAGSNTMNMTDKERGQNIQFLILPSTIAVVDKRTSLDCYYVQMCRTGEYACDTCSTHFYIIAGKGCSFIYLRNCIFYAHAAYSTVLDLGKSRLTHSRSPTETT